MTKAERLAMKIQRDRETLERKRQERAEQEATLRAEIRHSEATLRDETRKATNRRRYLVGALADEAGLLAWSDTDLAGIFAALAPLKAVPHPVAVLEAILGDAPQWSVGCEPGVDASMTHDSAAD